MLVFIYTESQNAEQNNKKMEFQSENYIFSYLHILYNIMV